MPEVFTYFAKKVADALLGEAFKRVLDKPKWLGQAMLTSHTRLRELENALGLFRIGLVAEGMRVKGNIPTLKSA